MSHSCKEKEMIKFLFLVILSAFVIIYSRQTSDSVRSSITFAVTTVIPALFPFMVLSRMIASSDALQYILSPSEKVTVKLFNISCNGMIPVIIGFITGFPIGAVTVCEKYKKGEYSKGEAERLLALSHNTGPSFPIGFIGIQLWGSARFGLFLYLSQIIPWLLATTLWKGRHKAERTQTSAVNGKRRSSLIIQITDAVSSAALASISVAAFTVFFGFCLGAIDILMPKMTFSARAFMSSLLELTDGCCYAARLGGTVGCALTGFAVGFGGLSALMQASSAACVQGLSVKTLIRIKLISGIVCALLAAGYYICFPIEAQSVFAPASLSVDTPVLQCITIVSIISILFIFLTKDFKRR